MSDSFVQAEEFQRQRARLESLAKRILGQRAEAQEIVQEAWLRLQSQPAQEIQTPAGWLTTVVRHLCLDELRTRKRRDHAASVTSAITGLEADVSGNPEEHLVMADAVGAALLVVLDRLQPAERIAFAHVP